MLPSKRTPSTSLEAKLRGFSPQYPQFLRHTLNSPNAIARSCRSAPGLCVRTTSRCVDNPREHAHGGGTRHHRYVEQLRGAVTFSMSMRIDPENVLSLADSMAAPARAVPVVDYEIDRLKALDAAAWQDLFDRH